jgi:hypothetical protein
MYRSNGQPMTYKEEGAAFLPPTRATGSMVPPRPMGLQRGMLTDGFVEAQAQLNAPRVMGLNPQLLTQGFPGARGVGDLSSSISDVGAGKLALIGVAGAVVGFMIWRKR